MIDQREKTLVFCATQDHALAVRDLINQMKTSTDPNYCVRVTANDGALGDQHLREFQDNEKTIPTILTTSQKLSTGVDARNVRNIVLMRPINSMIEFKQIIGRGTRLYDGKDYFTIYDFVKAHHHFSDPEWDGEPMEPEPPKPRRRSRRRRADVRPGEPTPRPTPSRRPAKIKVKLADGKERTIQSMMADDLLEPRRHAHVRRAVPREPVRRAARVLQGRGRAARASGAHPTRARRCWQGWPRRASAASRWRRCSRSSTPRTATSSTCWPTSPSPLPPMTRAERADAGPGRRSRPHYTDRQQAFLDFVLAQYVKQGVDELDQDKLSPLLRLKYRALTDAFAELGRPEQVRRVFVGFQRHLYAGGQARAAAVTSRGISRRDPFAALTSPRSSARRRLRA